ncbi:MAG: glycosyltransferase family 2 protein [Bacteroidales bacterium]|nr:glycosyltransferase family 2 protein [Bacteroidales bacterium]
MITLYIVTPCLNEEEVLPISLSKLLSIMDSLEAEGMISPLSRILVVNDGSTDGTWALVEKMHAKDPRVCGVDLVQNSGHQAALLAGMSVAREKADAVITIDSDLQDDPDAIREMVQKHSEGAEVVYGVRSNRSSDTFLKRNTAHLFYGIMRLLGTKVIPDHADYRLMGKASMLKLAEYGEDDIYLRGIVPKMGFPSAKVYYVRNERAAGETSYTFAKSFKLAVGILGEYTGIKKRRSSHYDIKTVLI